MTGYYNKPEATAEALKDGWFHTGDIGTHRRATATCAITDRKKDLLVTSGGKKIAPQPIEAVLKRSPLVAEAVLLGDRRKLRRGADRARLRGARAPAEGSRPSARRSRAELVTRADVLALYQEIVDALNRELSQFERIKRIALLPARVLDRVRRADADAEGEAEGGRGAMAGRDRGAVRELNAEVLSSESRECSQSMRLCDSAFSDSELGMSAFQRSVGGGSM